MEVELELVVEVVVVVGADVVLVDDDDVEDAVCSYIVNEYVIIVVINH